MDHDKIKHYLIEYQDQIRSSIFCNADRKDMFIKKKTITEHFTNKKTSVGRGCFFKKIKNDLYKDSL